MRQPERGGVGGTTQACTLLCRGTRWQGRKTDIVLSDMRIGASIADLMLNPASNRAHRGRV